MNKLRLPNITAPTAAGQIAQIIAYLRQMATELNLALEELERNKKEVE